MEKEGEVIFLSRFFLSSNLSANQPLRKSWQGSSEQLVPVKEVAESGVGSGQIELSDGRPISPL